MKESPENDDQVQQVYDWYDAQDRPVSLPEPCAFGIWNKSGSEILEVISRDPYLEATRLLTEDATRADQNRGDSSADKLGRVAIKVMPEDAPSFANSRFAAEASVMRAMSG